MRIVFFGSSSFSLPSLHALARSDRHHLAGVVTQPDRPSGRNRQVHRGVVHQAALELGLPLMLPEKVGSGDALEMLRGWQPGLIAVASYGQYIPTPVLQLPRAGVINVHPSLLPRYRGAAPLQWSVANGETISGVTLFRVVKEMDAGDILMQERYPVGPDETAAELSERFAAAGAQLLLKTIDGLEAGTLTPVPQDHAAATYAPKIAKADGLVDWRKSSRELHNRIRGFQPWPGGYFMHEGRVIKVWRSRPEPGHGPAGQVLDLAGEGPLVAAGEGALRLLELQPEGKKVMDGAAFVRGSRWTPGMMLG